MVSGSEIRDPRSGIRKKPIPDPGSRGQKGTGSRIRIRNTGKLSINVFQTYYLFLQPLKPDVLRPKFFLS
jgi:hypothetical protein